METTKKEFKVLSVAELIRQLQEVEKIDPTAAVWVYGFDDLFEPVLRVVYDKGSPVKHSHVELAVI
jgi:hypothetical protein